MNTYIISDIHGCFDKFQAMLKKIEFSENDQLVVAGDYIDRGSQSYEMLQWIENCPENVLLICGNHDKEFAANIELMEQVYNGNKLSADLQSNEATKLLYELTVEVLSVQYGGGFSYYDYYGTIKSLITNYGAAFTDLKRWAKLLDEMPFHYSFKINDRKCIIVHAGYIESLDGVDTEQNFSSLEDFYMYGKG